MKLKDKIRNFVCRKPLDEEYVLFQGDRCPCKKTDCERHGDCAACMAHHHDPQHETKTECDRLKYKIDRRRR